MTPNLPHLPISLTDEKQHKRDRDDYLATSSDPPLFSSDPPVASTSIDDYEEPKRKRQHKGSCYAVDAQEDLCLKKATRNLKARGAHHRRRGFRKFDSAVYMGSDESLPSDLSDPFEEHGSCDSTIQPGDLEAEVGDDMTCMKLSRRQLQDDIEVDAFWESSLLDKAIQTVEDPGEFVGPIFPYWQEQPVDIKHFHNAQKLAQEKVLRCVDRGDEVIDLSNSYLRQIRTTTLRPLRLHVRQDVHQGKGSPAKYKRFTPSLTLFLSNNDLNAIPGELYHLKTLEVLSLRGNNIEEILPAIKQLTCLKELNLASNQLSYLPYELLSLPKESLRTWTLTLYPNPFIRPIRFVTDKVLAWPRRGGEVESSHSSNDFHHVASTYPSFLDITGNPMREYPPAPSHLPTHYPIPGEIVAHTARPTLDLRRRTPSLLESVLRNLQTAPELSQLPFHISPTENPGLHKLLQRTYYLSESGGQQCTMCGTGFIIPRTEWMEWWTRGGNAEPLPFIRRGCSWACFPDNDDENVGNVEKVGWRSGKEEMEDSSFERRK